MITDVISRIDMGNFPIPIKIRVVDEDCYSTRVFVVMKTFDRDTGSPTEICGDVIVDQRSDADSIVHRIYLRIKQLLAHELQEQIRYNEKHLFDPHANDR